MRRPRRAAAVVALVGALSAASISVTGSSAAWRQDEWTHGAVGALDCADPAGLLVSRAHGRLLDGTLLPTDLGAVASVSGVTVVHDGQTAQPDPPAASQVGPDAHAHPLDASALALVQLPLTGTTLADVLRLPLDTDVGALSQYASARADGTALGAAGLVNDSGAIMTDAELPAGPPTLGVVQLSTLVQALTGQAIADIAAGVTDLSLQIGAVAARAAADGCEARWGVDGSVQRDYAIAAMAAHADSPAVAGLSTALDAALDDVESLVNGLAGDAGVVADITSGVGGLLDDVLGTLSLGEITLVGPSVDVDLSAARALGGAEISDPDGLVRLDLSDGSVQVDLAALFGEEYGGHGFADPIQHGLNGLPPNTQLIVNEEVIQALTTALGEALEAWVADVISAVELALYAADVELSIAIALRLAVPVATVNVTANGTLHDLLTAEPGSVTASLSLLGANCPINPLACIVDGLTAGILGALTSGVGPVVGGVLEEAIFDETSAVGTLGSTLSATADPIVDLLAQLLNGYLGAEGLVSLHANAQNDPPPGEQFFDAWEAGPSAVADGRHAVAALIVGVVDDLGPGANVSLELARGEAGPFCTVAATACNLD